MNNSTLPQYLFIFLILVATDFVECADSDADADDQIKVAGRNLTEWTVDLSSKNEIVRLRATKTLGVFGASAIPALTTALSDSSAGVKYWAASELGDIGLPARSAIPQLLKIHKEKFIGLRISAAYALCRLGELNKGLPTLIEALKYPERGVANSSGDFLARIGPPAKPAIPALEEALNHSDYHVKGAALEALRRIRGQKPTK